MIKSLCTIATATILAGCCTPPPPEIQLVTEYKPYTVYPKHATTVQKCAPRDVSDADDSGDVVVKAHYNLVCWKTEALHRREADELYEKTRLAAETSAAASSPASSPR
jgi:hypothetical protein